MIPLILNLILLGAVIVLGLQVRRLSKRLESAPELEQALETHRKEWESTLRKKMSEWGELKDTHLSQLNAKYASELAKSEQWANTELASNRKKIEETVNKAYAEAVKNIDFHRIEYKKTITKKRRKASKSDPVDGSPFRSIEDD